MDEPKPERKSEAEMAAAAQRVFDNCPEAAHVETFDHERAVGFVIQWSLPGKGFGEITIARHKGTRTGAEVSAPDGDDTPWVVDDEEISAETVGRILRIALPDYVTTLDFQNLGCKITTEKLLAAFDDIATTGEHAGRFGSEGMNALVDRYTAARAALQRIMQALGPEVPTGAECAGCAFEIGEALAALRAAGIAYRPRTRTPEAT